MRTKINQTHKFAIFALVLNLDDRLSALILDLERPMLHVTLDLRVVVSSPNETLSVKYGVFGIRVESVLCGVADETFVICEGNP